MLLIVPCTLQSEIENYDVTTEAPEQQTTIGMLQFHIFAISAAQVNLHNYCGKHLLLFTKGWILTNLIGQFLPAMCVTRYR